jgi:hypothetical protein
MTSESVSRSSEVYLGGTIGDVKGPEKCAACSVSRRCLAVSYCGGNVARLS